MIRLKNIICISTSDWDSPWGSKQQLMLKLSRDNRILYVEYQASFLHVFFPLTCKRIFTIFGKLRKINDNLLIYTPPLFLLPFGNYLRFINKINQKILSFFIKRDIQKYGFSEPILWVYSPLAADLLKYIKVSLIIYHCIADFSSEKKCRLREKTLAGMEEGLLKRTDIVAAMSKELFEKFKKTQIKTIYFPSAVDFDFFQEKLNEITEIPGDLKNVKRPILGVVGYLDPNILDIELLEYLAINKPQWSLVFVGPVVRGANSFRGLWRKKNVYFLGAKSHNDIPGYIKYFDAGLIPYRQSKFIKNVSPLKLYEYFAMGKAVVATAGFSEACEYNGAMYCVNEKAGFVESIEKALAEHDNGLISIRKKIAEDNSWDRRIQLIQNSLPKKSAKYC